MKKEIQHNFDFGNIQKEHKDAANEIILLLKNMGVNELVCELIKQKFNIIDIPTYDVKTSVFGNFCKEKNIFVATQGWIVEGVDLQAKKYPICSVNEDIRKLDDLASYIFNQGRNNKK